MRFIRRNQYLLLFASVLVLASVMVLRQFAANQSAHVEMREDFFVLCGRGETKASERFYQLLIQQLPKLNDASLAGDLERTAMLVNSKTLAPGSLIWKYHVSVNNELHKRAEQRIARSLQQAERQ
jgi:hypothetical protein